MTENVDNENTDIYLAQSLLILADLIDLTPKFTPAPNITDTSISKQN